MDELLPCPFCGGKVTIRGKEIDPYIRQWEINCVNCDLQMGGIYGSRKSMDSISRNSKGELTIHDGKAFSIKSWNTRHYG